MDPEYIHAYRDLYQRHWWWRAREEFLVELIRRQFPARANLRILDVGCGSGLFFDRLREFGTAVGVEPDQSLAKAESRFEADIHHGELATLTATHKFDLILLLDVLEHVGAAESLMNRALGLLEPEGRIVVTVPACPMLWTHHDALNHHIRRYTRGTLAQLVHDAGGRVQGMRYFFHWLFALKLAVRLVEVVRGPRGVERVPPAAVNRALYAMSRVEQRLFNLIPLPFGSSLLAICCKR